MNGPQLTNSRQSWICALACASGLLFPAFASAGLLDDIKNGITQSFSDAAHKGVDSTRQSVDEALGSSAQSGGQSASAAHPPGGGSDIPVAATDGLPANVPGSAECISIQPDGTNTKVTNTCASSIWILYHYPSSPRCVHDSVKAGRRTPINYRTVVSAVCRYNGVMIPLGSCKCAAGTELSGGAGAAGS
jgi:hypothetical protein